MKHTTFSTVRPGSARVIQSLLAPIAAALICATTPLSSGSQSDNFNDGNDTGWTRYSPLAQFGLPSLFTFPSGGYRIQVPAATGMANNPSRAGSIREDAVYTDFYVTVDLVNWKDDTRQAFGLLARLGTPGLGATTGYAFTYERGSGVNATSGGTDISKITGEVPSGLGSGTYHLDPAKDYRFVFIGQGSSLQGRIYELPDVMTPVHSISGSDSTYASGFCGLVVYDNGGGTGVCDATFDNYFASDVEPPTLSIVDLGFDAIKISWPSSPTGFKLQASPVLPATTWTDVTQPPTDDGTTSFVIIDPSVIDPMTGSRNSFYRLAKP